MNHIHTIDQAHRLLGQLEGLEKNLYKAGVSVNQVLETVFGKEEKDFFLAECAKNGVQVDNIPGVKKVIAGIHQSIRSLPKLEVQIAVTPTEYLVKTIAEWVERNTGGKKLLDITVNPKLIGGAAISINGLYRDYSVRKQLVQDS